MGNVKVYQSNDAEKKPEMINIKDVIMLASQLDKFIEVYDKSIYLQNEEQREALEQLKVISAYFKKHDYLTLFEEHVQDIDFNPNNTKFTPEELKSWEEFFRKNPYRKE